MATIRIDWEITLTVPVEVEVIEEQDDDGVRNGGNSLTGARDTTNYEVEDVQLGVPDVDAAKLLRDAIEDSRDSIAERALEKACWEGGA